MIKSQAIDELYLINKYITPYIKTGKDVVLGVGDDAALVKPPKGYQLVISTDTMVADKHFLAGMPSYAIGHKALAVNLSDLAAMGAKPHWITLALTLPNTNEKWLHGFIYGLTELANYYKVTLIGGDLTKGSLSITIAIIGSTLPNKALLRSGAKPGDLLYVTGYLGDSAAGLQLLKNQINVDVIYKNYFIHQHYNPSPRVFFGQSLTNIANAAIDISDGLLCDLKRLLIASQCQAQIQLDKLPLSSSMTASMALKQATQLVLTGGEDYELIFTVPPSKITQLDANLACHGLNYTCIGHLSAGQGEINLLQHGYKYAAFDLTCWDSFTNCGYDYNKT